MKRWARTYLDPRLRGDDEEEVCLFNVGISANLGLRSKLAKHCHAIISGLRMSSIR